MTVANLRPLAVSVDNAPWFVPPDLVGGPTAASDDSDATYAEVWSSDRVGTGRNDFVIATFSALGGLSSLSGISLTVRYELVPGATLANPLGLAAWANPTPDFLGEFGRFVSPTADAIVSQTYSFDGALGPVGTALAAGTFFLTLNPGEHGGADGTDKMLRVYEITLTVDYVPAASHAPACRKYPREDRLGVGSGRHYPPPRSQQFSARRAGGYY